MQGKTNEYQKALKLKRERFQEELDGFSSQVSKETNVLKKENMTS